MYIYIYIYISLPVRILKALLLSSLLVTCPAHLIIYLIALTIDELSSYRTSVRWIKLW